LVDNILRHGGPEIKLIIGNASCASASEIPVLAEAERRRRRSFVREWYVAGVAGKGAILL
jgi:hypothetical protein